MADNEVMIQNTNTTGAGPVPNPNQVGDGLLQEIRELTKKQVRWQRLSSLCMAGIFVVVAVAVFIMVPKALDTLANLNATVDQAQASLKEIDTMVAEMTDASASLNELVDNNEKSLTDAIEKMAGVDYDGLNKAITDLQDAVGPMASFFNRFR